MWPKGCHMATKTTQPPPVWVVSDSDSKSSIGYTAPNNVPAEEALLGSLLYAPRTYHKIAGQINDDSFYLLKHRWIFNAIVTLITSGTPVDLVTVTDELQRRKQLDDIGGPAYLTRLLRNTPTTSHATFYADMVQNAAVRVSLLHELDKTHAKLLDESTVTEDVIREHAQAVQAIATPLFNRHEPTIADLVHESLDHAEKARLSPQYGIRTITSGLTRLLGGWHKQKLNYICACPHHGKTAFMMTNAILAAEDGHKVGFYNVADGNQRSVTNRMIAMMAGIAPLQIETGAFNDDDFAAYFQSCEDMAAMTNLHVYSQKMMDVEDLALKLKARKDAEGLDIVFIDYGQRLRTKTFKSNEVEKLAIISSQLLAVAEAIDAPVVCGLQVNHRAIEARQDKRPGLGDIKGSGAFVEDADTITLLYREGVYNPAVMAPGITSLIVAKNRLTGDLGTLQARFNFRSTRLEDIKKEYEDEGSIRLPKSAR